MFVLSYQTLTPLLPHSPHTHTPPSLLRATVQSCLPDFEHDSKRSFVQHVRFSPSEGFFPSDGFPSEQPGVSLTTPSPSRSAFVTVRTHKSGDSKQQYIEKWTDSGLTASVPVDKAHGPVCGDAWFGGIVWTADEECVLYVAEETPPKATDFFDRAPDAKGRGGAFVLGLSLCVGVGCCCCCCLFDVCISSLQGPHTPSNPFSFSPASSQPSHTRPPITITTISITQPSTSFKRTGVSCSRGRGLHDCTLRASPPTGS